MPNLIQDSSRKSYNKPERSNDRLRHALAERERFLRKNPHLRSYQDEIDRLLDLSGDSHGRMTVLGTLMQGKLLEMRDQFKRLRRYMHPPATRKVPFEAIDVPKAPADNCRQPCL